LAIDLQEGHICPEGIGWQKSECFLLISNKYEEAKRTYKNERKEYPKTIILSILSFVFSI
jgi:hypothetical protein